MKNACIFSFKTFSLLCGFQAFVQVPSPMYFPLNKLFSLLNVCLSVKPPRRCESHRQIQTIGSLGSALQPTPGSFVESFRNISKEAALVNHAGTEGRVVHFAFHAENPLGFNALVAHNLIFKIVFRATSSKSQSLTDFFHPSILQHLPLLLPTTS